MSAAVARRGLMLVLSSPSGAGKTTLSRRLLETQTNLVLSVSATTRPKRPGEVEGVDYRFVTGAQFDRSIAQGELLEFATVFDHRYGTPREPAMSALSAGHDVLFDIDWQGTQRLKEQAPQDLVSVFVLPPSHAELERRLKSRAQDAEGVVSRRMARAAGEISHWAEYDYVVINEDVETAHAELVSILAAERLKRSRQTGLSEFVRALMQERSSGAASKE